MAITWRLNQGLSPSATSVKNTLQQVVKGHRSRFMEITCFSQKRVKIRIMLNIGGIGNFTYLPGSTDSNKVFVTDTGPGNTLIDQAVQQYKPGTYFDKDSNIAKKGKVNDRLLKELLDRQVF